MERETVIQDPEDRQENPESTVDPADTAHAQPEITFPDEPFPCPHCGQLLAPSCRVCVSCNQPIDPREIVRPAAMVQAAEAVTPQLPAEPARFSWTTFFSVLAIWFIVALVSQRLLGYERSQFILGGIVIITSAWVLHDANKKGIPKGLRWSIGSLLVWIVIFPWYLARRRTPEAPCPFIEGEASRVTRALLFVLAVSFLLSALMLIIKGRVHH